MSDFILDVERIRNEARKQTFEGAVTPDYKADREAILKLLAASMATEWICMLRYTQHSLVAQGIHAESVSRHFSEHAAQEQGHAMKLAERIRQLGGKPHLDPSGFSALSHAEYKECDSLEEMIKENLIAERIAIESYSEIIRYIGDRDPTSRRLFENILEVEEEHADEMADLLAASGAGKNHHMN